MGKAVEEIAIERGHEIVFKINSHTIGELTKETMQRAQVVIDFSKPDVVTGNIKMCFDAGVPIVVGTTGWYDEMEEIKALCLQKKSSMLFASNFSIGVNLFFEINQRLAQLMGAKDYTCSMEEIHHTQKLDKPSGTAITLANDIVSSSKKYEGWSLEQKQNFIAINSIRKENVLGIHSVTWQNDIDKIEIKHESFNRKGFAQGAVLAAEWLAGKKGFYTMRDVLAL